MGSDYSVAVMQVRQTKGRRRALNISTIIRAIRGNRGSGSGWSFVIVVSVDATEHAGVGVGLEVFD